MAALLPRVKKYYLFPARSVSVESAIRKMTWEQAIKKEAEGTCRRVYDTATGELRGLQLIAPEETQVDRDLPSMPSSCTVMAWEMDLNLERSRTVGLTEDRRLERVASHWPPEDQAERVQAKVRMIPVLGTARGDILRVWPRP